MKNYLKFLIDSIYKVNDVQSGYFFWRGKLIDILMDLFEYGGLPETIPEKEIEKRLIITGHCGFIKHPTLGLIVCDSSLYDYDVYRRYKRANFYNPYKKFVLKFIPNSKEIGKDCEMIYNNSIEEYVDFNFQSQDNVFQEICRYARLLADLESTINLNIINSRQPYILTANDQNTVNSIIDVFRKMKRGEMAAVLDKNIIKDATSLKNYEVVTGYLTELLEARNSLIKNFLADFGIYSTDDKKERLIVDEMEQENRNVKVFIYSMLKERRIGVEKVNKLFGTNISVRIRQEIYDKTELYEESTETEEVKEEEEVQNDNQRISENEENSD